MGFGGCSGLFGRRRKCEVWLEIERELIRFLNGKGLIDDFSLARIEGDLDTKIFEVLGSLEGNESDFDRFMDFIFSQSSVLKRFSSIASIGRFNFEDTYTSVVLKECNDLLTEELDRLQEKLRRLSNRYKTIVQMGRTHGVHAEPISFGCKFASCRCDMERVLEDFCGFRKYLETVVVDHDDLGGSSAYEGLQEHLSKRLGLWCEFSNFNSFPKERYSQYLALLSSMAGILHKLSLDLHFADYDEVGEVRFPEGSSDSYERIELASKLIRAHSSGFSDLICGYSEDSGLLLDAERFHLFESAKHLLSLVRELDSVLEGMEVVDENLKRNLELSRRSIFSQAVMLHILKRGKFTRQEVLEDMKILFSRVTDGTPGLHRELLNSPKYGSLFSRSDLEQIFSWESHFSHMEDVYRRALGISESMSLFPEEKWNKNQIFQALDKLSERINAEYSGTAKPVTVVAFSRRSLILLGNLMTRFGFPVRVVVFESGEEDGGRVKSLTFDGDSAAGTRVLLLDYMVTNRDNLNDFIDRFRKQASPSDIMVCSLLKSKDLDHGRVRVDFWGLECEERGEYFGFGKTSGSGSTFAQIPRIGHSS